MSPSSQHFREPQRDRSLYFNVVVDEIGQPGFLKSLTKFGNSQAASFPLNIVLLEVVELKAVQSMTES